MPQLDLRRTPPPTPAPAAAAPKPATKPALPAFGLPTGQLLTADDLSPQERDQLLAIGWKEGEPVANIADVVAQAKASAASVMTGVQGAANVKPENDNVNLADLPPAERAKINAARQQMLADEAAATARRAQMVDNPGDPSVNAAIEFALDAEGAAIQVSRKEAGLATAAPVDHICKNCGWHSEKEPLEITEAHKEKFRLELLGSRFTETYELFGGSLIVKFRGLTREEYELGIQQASYDERDGKIAVNHEYLRTIFNYGMVLAIEEIRIGDKVTRFPDINSPDVFYDKVDEQGRPQTALSAFYPYVMSQIPSAALLRSLTLVYGRFEELQKRIVAQLFNSDF